MPASATTKTPIDGSFVDLANMMAIPLVNAIAKAFEDPEVIARLRKFPTVGDEIGLSRGNSLTAAG